MSASAQDRHLKTALDETRLLILGARTVACALSGLWLAEPLWLRACFRTVAGAREIGHDRA